MALRLLLRRTELKALWAAGNNIENLDMLEARASLYLGARAQYGSSEAPESSIPTAKQVAAMTHEQRMEFMDKQLKAAGIDPSTLMSKNIQFPPSK